MMERGSVTPRATLGVWSTEIEKKAFVKERQSTGVLECWGAAYSLEKFALACQSKRVEVRMDNSASAQAIESGFSRRPEMMTPIRRIRRLCATHNIHLRVRFVRGDLFNKIADALSHNLIGEAQCHAARELGLQLLL
jgi:hypothetical protein